ncbi:MAG: cytochrome c biogenesis protein CcsA [Planctomycetes bacterium]|nr:cytochrome c biogenesis protein CcsA [Planctomycetota bacterium]
MKAIHWLLPSAVVLLGALMLLAAMRSKHDRAGEMQVRLFGRIPVVQAGRIKPMDTVARTSLMIISGRGEEYTDLDGQKQPAIRWLLDVMSSGEKQKDSDPTRQLKVFRIENDQVLGLLHLTPRSGFRYSIDEIMSGNEEQRPKEEAEESNFTRLTARIKAAKEKKTSDRDLVDTKVLELEAKLGLYYQLAEKQVPHVIPPDKPGAEWQTFAEAQEEARAGGATELSGDARLFDEILKSYAADKTSAFNSGVEKYLAIMQRTQAKPASVASFEVFFNNFAPFYRSVILYACIFFLALLGWMVFPLGWSRPLWWSAFALMVLVFAVHTFAIIARIYIQGRPPVTNLYSSAIFIGWAVVLIGIVIELLSRLGVATAVAAMVGIITLIVAHNLGNDGDTMEMLRAVLDTNFWLATHVTAVTIGYAATFMAGALGVAYILLGVFTPLLKQDLGDVYESLDASRPAVKMDVAKLLSTMTYGVVCFAMFFSFVGTVLGGIWADQSWGRFWGWDPKENGAVLIVIWNALILHARWGGMVRQRGMAMLAVGGNIVTVWSWFGVNMLEVGLHSYGFIPSAFKWLVVFAVSQLAIILIAAWPEKLWMSYKPKAEPPKRAPRRTEESVEAIVVG